MSRLRSFSMFLRLLLLVSTVLLSNCSDQIPSTPVESQTPTSGTVGPDDSTVQERPWEWEWDEPPYPIAVAGEWHDRSYYEDWNRPVREGMIDVKPGLRLLIWNYDYDTIYLVERGNAVRILAGAVDNAEIELVTPEVVKLRCYSNDSGFRGFPTRLIYDVDKDEAILDVVYWDCSNPLRFNYYVKCDDREPPVPGGIEILDIVADNTTVTLKYSPWPDDPTWTGPPEIITFFDEQTLAFAVLFMRCSAKEDLCERVQKLGSTDVYRSLNLSQTEEGVLLSVELVGQAEFRTECYPGGPFSITFHFKNK